MGVERAQLTMDSVDALEWERRRVRELLDGLVEHCKVAECEFMKCRREREIVENALALQKASYDEERARHEQAQIDDGILQRINRERGAAADEN